MEKQPIRVLFVEDSPDDAELVQLELESNGFAVQGRRVDTRDTFVAALTEPWDVILSDFQMPCFSGLAAFEAYMASGQDVPFLFVSGALGEEAAVQAMRAGARDYLVKDNLARLAVAVRREIAAAKNRRLQREAEALAMRDQRRLAMAVAASGVGVYEIDLPDGGDVYVSDRWAEILGYTRAQVAAFGDLITWFSGQVHPDDRATVAASGAAVAAGAERVESELRVRHKAGHWVEVASASRVVERDPLTGRTKLVGVLTDLSERRRLEAQLRQAQKMEAVGRLAGGIAHDFNNLLTVILSFGSLVLDGLVPGSEAHDDMQEILRAGERAATLTGQLLAFSRRKTVAPRIVDANDIVADMDRLFRRLLGEDIDLRTVCASGLARVRLDPSAFEQVLVNLAVNARDAMPDGGRLTLETYDVALDTGYGDAHGAVVPPGRYVVVALTDTGCGMSDEVLRHIFEPFFTTKSQDKGTGLGLSTCYGIVKQAGGFIWVYSEVGVGTTFKIHLPALEAAPEPVVARVEPGSTRGGEVVLVAEDNGAVRKLATRVLSDLGYQVLAAADARSALHLSDERLEAIDLLVSDVVMPGMSGRELAERLTKDRPEMRVLFMSGYTENAISHRGALTPGTRVLQKPFTPEVFARTVRQVLDE